MPTTHDASNFMATHGRANLDPNALSVKHLDLEDGLSHSSDAVFEEAGGALGAG